MDNLVLTTDTGLDQYGVGCALTTQLQMAVKNEVLIIPKDKITIEIGLEIFNETTNQNEILYSPLGTFYVDSLEEKGIKKSIKAYDGMFKLQNGYFPSAKHTTTQAIANDIAIANGYKVKGVSNVSINNEQIEGKTCVEMLSLVASAIGTNVRISRDGSTIEFVEPTATGLTFDESYLSTATLDDTTTYNITKLRVNYSEQVTNDNGVVTDEGYFTVGTGTDAQTLELSNPLLKGQQAQATNVLNKIKQLNGYKRFDTSMPFADFRLETMDLVTYSKGGTNYLVPILYMKMTLSYQGVAIETQSPTLAETKSEFSFKGTLSQKVENIYTDIIQVKQLTANKVTTDELEATVATIEKLYATKAEIGELVAGSIVVEELKAQVAEIDKLVANKADINDLTTLNATIGSLKAKVAEIDTLIAGSILSEIIQSGSISSDLLNVKDGFIKDAMISSLSASKIDSGVINTNNVLITSDNGNMTLQGNLLQFKDKNGKVRIQIGQDTTGNYTFTLYDSTGKGVLINQDGIQSSNAIKDGLIVDSKVADNANISGSKLNISSLYDSMNADGSKALKASKVYLDDKEQTLDVSFKEMTTKQNDLEDSMNTAITDISVSKGQISQLIQDTTITTTGTTTKLKDAFNHAKSTVDSHTVSIGKVESALNSHNNQLGTMNKEVANLKVGLNGIEAGLSSLEQNVEDNYYNKTQTDSQINVAKDVITQSVSENYYSKNEFANSSVLNLIMNGGFENGTEHWERNGEFSDGKDIWSPHDSSASWVIWADRHRGFYQRFSCITGKTYSWSADVYIEAGCGNIGIEGLTSRYWHEGGWTKISGTFTATSAIHTFIIYGDYDTTTIIHIDNVMVCEGAIPHPYQPNYIDINSRLRLAEQKITPEAIVNTVRSEVYTKSETEKVINNKGYATQAQVTHTAEQVEYRFSQSGGYNVTRNGGFENGMTHWSMNNNPNILENQPWQNYDGKSLWISATSHGSGIFQFFPTTVGKVYSYSFYAQAEYGEWWAGVENAHTQTVSVSPNNWIRYTGTFTATSTSHAFVCYAYGGGRNVFIDNVMICEGVLPSAYTPHPSEVYDGITDVDKDGVKVTASHINGYTRMSAEGFLINKDNIDVFKVDGNGLAIRGSGANSGRYIKIENEDYTVWNGNVNCMRFGYKNWNGWDGVPEFLMGYKGMRYTESANTGEDASYFGMQTWGRNVRNNPNAYHEIYYRSDKFGNTSYIRFDEDGTVDYRSLGQTVIKHSASGHGIALAKYDGKDLSYVRPTLHNATDLGHESYRYRTIYATNGNINTSDISLKENINPIVSKANTPMLLIDNVKVAPSSEDYYEFVKTMPLYTYDYKSKDDEKDRALHNVGFIAQDIANTPVGDEFVFEGEDGIYQYNMQGYVGVLAVALQNALKKIDILEEKVSQLESKFKELYVPEKKR